VGREGLGVNVPEPAGSFEVHDEFTEQNRPEEIADDAAPEVVHVDTVVDAWNNHRQAGFLLASQAEGLLELAERLPPALSRGEQETLLGLTMDFAKRQHW